MWNLLQDELGGGVWPRLLVALVDTGAKGLILMAAAGLAAAALRRNAAAARHLVWMLALCGLLLLPVVSLMMPKWTMPILPALEAPAPPAIVAPLTPTPAPQPIPSNFMPPPADAPTPLRLDTTPINAPEPAPTTPPNATPPKPAPNPVNLPAWALVLWLAVAILSIAPFIAGIIAVARLRRRANTFADSDLQPLAACLAQTLALKRPARLLRAPTGTMPMATGFLQPAVFLPEDALTWTEEKRRVVLLHELAHVKRRDCLTHAIARTATALHWFNPLAWLALRQLRIEREHACDDLVLAAGERPSAYAENLLEIARTLRASTVVSAAAITMAQKSQLEGRLLAVLDAARNRGRVTKRLLIVSTIAAIASLLFISTVELARSESQVGTFELKYASGFTATLVGVSDATTKNPDVAWGPDGILLPAVPESKAGSSWSSPREGKVARRFHLRIQASAGEKTNYDFGVHFRIDPNDRSEMTANGGPNSTPFFSAILDEHKRVTSFDLGIASGPWQKVTEVTFGNSSAGKVGDTLYSILMTQTYTRDGETCFSATHSVKDRQWRIVLFDKENNMHKPSSTGGSGIEGMTQTDFVLGDIAPEKVDRVELQVRDYEWQKFEGIAVNPDNTDKSEIPNNSTPEKPDKVASSKQPKGDFSVEFPGGYRARVVGVGDSNGKPSEVFWAANGAPLDTAPEGFQGEQSCVTPSSGSLGRMFFVELLPPPENPILGEVAFKSQAESPGSSGSQQLSRSESSVQNTLGTTWPQSTTEAFIKVGLAAGPWTTRIKSSIGSGESQTAENGEYNVIFSEAFVREGENRVIATHRHFEEDYRVVAVDASDAAHPLVTSGCTTTGDMMQSEWIFRDIAPEDVFALEVQTRNFEWKTISGIALYPAEKTAQSNAEQSSAYSSESPYSVFNNDYFGSVLEDPNLPTHIGGDALTPLAADASWGPVVNSLQAAVRFKPEKPEYVLGDKIDMEFLVRNTGPEPVEFLTSKTRHLQLDLSRQTSTSICVDLGLFNIRRVKLAPGEVTSIDGTGRAVMLKGTRRESGDLKGTYEVSRPDIHEVLFNLNFPDTYSSSGEFAPRPGDWTGTLTTGMRSINIAQPDVPVAEAQNASKPASYKQPENADANYSVEFPGGFRAHVVSVRDANGGFSGIFWAGDGSPIALARPAAVAGNFTLSPETIGRLFFVELLPPPDSPAMTDVTFICSIESPGSGAGGVSNSGSGDSLRNEFFSTFPMNTKEASVKVGVAAGPWKTVFSGCIGCDTGVSGSEFSATFSEVFDHEGAKRITVTHKPLAQERRVVAVNAAGDAHPLRMTISRDGEETSQSEWIFQTIEPENVKALEIQTRTYEWKTISGIALYPTEDPQPPGMQNELSSAPTSLGQVSEPNATTTKAGVAVEFPKDFPPATFEIHDHPIGFHRPRKYAFGPEDGEANGPQGTREGDITWTFQGKREDGWHYLFTRIPPGGEGRAIESEVVYTGYSNVVAFDDDWQWIGIVAKDSSIKSFNNSPVEAPLLRLSTHQYHVNGMPNVLKVSFGDWPNTASLGFVAIRCDGEEFMQFVAAPEPDKQAAPPSRNWGHILLGSSAPSTYDIDLDKTFGDDPDRPWRQLGKHRISVVLNLFMSSSSGAGSAFQNPAPFVEVETDEVEFEVVQELPEGYLQAKYEEGWEETLRGMLVGFRYYEQDPNGWNTIQFEWREGRRAVFPFNLAFDVALQEEGSDDLHAIGTLTAEANLPAPLAFNENYRFSKIESSADVLRAALGKSVRVVLTPSIAVAMSKPSIRSYYGREFTTRWMRLKPDASQAARGVSQGGLHSVSNYGEPNKKLLIEELGVICEAVADGGRIVQAPDASPHLLLLPDAFLPADAVETIQRDSERLHTSETTEVTVAPDTLNHIAVMTETGETWILVIDTDADLNRKVYYFQAFQSPDLPAATSKKIIGPVVEVTVRHSGKNCMIDFDTGKLFTPPEFNGTEEVFAWAAKNGIDLGGAIQDGRRGLTGMDLMLNPEDVTAWDNAATSLALNNDEFKFDKPRNPVYFGATEPLPATWTFKTREGGRGVYQILGSDQNEPKAVRIRYRMLENDKR